MSADEIQVRYVPDRQRFEARVAGRAAVVVLDVVPTRDVWTLSHTGVHPAIELRGVGTALVRAALAHARAENRPSAFSGGALRFTNVPEDQHRAHRCRMLRCWWLRGRCRALR